MTIEFTHAQLATLLAHELSRYDLQERSGRWAAIDDATDEVILGDDRRELMRLVAMRSETLDLSARPTIDGVPVLVAEVERDREGTFSVRACDLRGREVIEPGPFRTRDAALGCLRRLYD